MSKTMTGTRSGILASATLAALGTMAAAANINWVGGASPDATDFNNGLNWSGNAAPADLATSAGDVAVLPSTVTTNQPSLTTARGVKGLQIDASGWTLGGTGLALTVRGNSVSAGGNGVVTTNASGLNVIGSDITISTNNSNVTAFDVATGGTLRLDGLLTNSGSGQLIKTGGGTLQFNLATTSSTGTTSNLVVSAGKVEALAGIGVRTGTGGGEITIQNGATYDLIGVNASVKNMFLAAGGTLTSSSSTTRTFTVGQQTLNTDLAGLISGNLNLSLAGNTTPRAIALSNDNNSFTGSMTVGSRTVITVNKLANGGQNSAIGASSNAAANLVISDAALRYTGPAVTIDRSYSINNNGGFQADGSGALVITGQFAAVHNSFNTGTFRLLGTNPNGNTLTAAINDGASSRAVALAKSETGTWILTGSSLYSKGTTISGGTLLVNNLSGSGTGTSTVAVSAGTLGGTGTASGAVTIGNGTGTDDSFLSPGTIGTAIESLNTGALTLASDAVFVAQLNSNTVISDSVASSGAITLGNGLAALQLSDLGSMTLSPSTVFTLMTSASPITGYFRNLAPVLGVGPEVTVGNNLYRLDFGTNAVTLTVVPEPTALALMGLVGLPAMLRRRR